MVEPGAGFFSMLVCARGLGASLVRALSSFWPACFGNGGSEVSGLFWILGYIEVQCCDMLLEFVESSLRFESRHLSIKCIST